MAVVRSPLFIRIKLLFIVTASLLLTGCFAPDPQDDIPLFEAFIAENINKKPDDPYISSTVRPGDKMYPVLLNFQRGRWDISGDILYSLEEQGDIEAMVWLAKGTMLDIEMRNDVITWLQKGIEAGNPYAALALSNRYDDCLDYLGKGSLHSDVAQSLGMESASNIELCSEANYQKAVAGFTKLAEQGDLRAQYFLLKQQELDKSTKTRQQYIQAVIRFAEGHYYQPLMDYVDTILLPVKGTYKHNSKTLEQYQLSLNLLQIAANNNYIPAIIKLINVQFENVEIKKNNPLLYKGKKIGSSKVASRGIYEIYENDPEYTLEELYFDVALYTLLTGNDKFIFWMKDDDTLPNEDQIKKIDQQAQEFFNQMTPMVYIDGFTDFTDWKE